MSASLVESDHEPLESDGFVREEKRIVIDEQLDRLYALHGTLTPQLVVEAAQDADHPLHGFFEWRDDVAATKYRLEQARQMIMASRMVVEVVEAAKRPATEAPDTVQTRRLVNAFRGQGFHPREKVLAEQEERKAFVEKKLAALRGWVSSVADIGELVELRVAVQLALSKTLT